MALKKTPLFESHVALNAKMAPFAGFEMPIQYQSIVDEHLAVRRAAGIFDVSHMGNFYVEGKSSAEYLNRLVTGDVQNLGRGKAFYTLLCNARGGAVDDLLVYALPDGRYLLIVNAANIEKDFSWLESQLSGDVRLSDESAETSILALQGPRAPEMLDAVCETKFSPLPSFTVMENKIKGISLYISRTGYTGEDGCEIVVSNGGAVDVWTALMEKGAVPAGLGARDTLRLEMGYTLYGHEITEETNVLEAGLGWVVNFDKPDFVGKEALLRSKAKGLFRRLVGLSAAGKGIPRLGAKIMKGGTEVGTVSSGGYSPVLEKGIALGYVEKNCANLGDSLEIEVRERRLPVTVVNRKFLSK